MGRRFDEASPAEGIILKEELLMPEYVPEDLLHRQAEMQEVAQAIKPLLSGKQPDNLFIHGNSGTGKTTCVKHVLKELDDHTSKVKAVYVNCWQHCTRMAVYWQIAHALQEPIPRRGWATDEIFQRVMEVLQRQNIKILLVLDELDGLFFRGEEKLLYELARSGNGKPIFGIIGISNNPRLLDGQDARVKSSLRFSSLQFKNYSETELYDILSTRAKASLKSGACPREILEKCSSKAFAQKSNVRIGLELLWKSANNAEKAGRTHIDLEDVNAAEKKGFYESQKSLQEFILKEKTRSLTEEEQLICEILKRGEKTSPELYQEFVGTLDRTKRQIRNYLKALAAREIIVLADWDESETVIPTKKIRLNV